MKVVVTGASGFVGSHTVEALLASGHEVVGLSRSKIKLERRAAGAVRYISDVDVADPSTLSSSHFATADAVVHLVGIIAEKPPQQTYARIHVQGTRNVVAAARRAGVSRLIYVSAIGAAQDASAEYSRTKFAAEEIVRASGIPYTVLRPSIILGADGEFAEQMRDLVQFGGLPAKIPLPVIPVPGSGRNQFQPIYIDDLTSCITQATSGLSSENKTIELGGETRVTFDQLIQAFAEGEHVSKPLLHVPLALLSVVAPLVESLPNPPFTGDQLRNLKLDNVADLTQMRTAFKLEPVSFQQQIERIYARRGTSRR